MNLKALITTLVLGSSTMASADSVRFSGSVSVSLGSAPVRRVPAPAPVIVRDHRVVTQDPCSTSYVAPASNYIPASSVIVRPAEPVWSGPFYNPNNTHLGGDSSSYIGTMGHSAITFRPWNERVTQNWFDMTEATRIDRHRLFLGVQDTGYYRAIEIDSLGARGSDIVQVRIDFKDHLDNKGYQLVKINQRIDRNNPRLTIDLDGDYRQISRIIVYGATDNGSAIKLRAM